MNFATGENLIRVVLDTNVLVSAILFGGKPYRILRLALEEKIICAISPSLITEIREVFSKKFPLKEEAFQLTLKNIEVIFKIVQPGKIIYASRDKDDNRVLEAAAEGDCKYIVTGDEDLLQLKIYRGIKIVTPGEFLEDFEN
ncbi:MAG: putative toxin-antitoxin system toxin component, PIN family [Candidatus Levybacteria bacterium]|nr:putative toxin-antitoxin system toxin component, PIN family [Candidatus Levybacteria bacterium]